MNNPPRVTGARLLSEYVADVSEQSAIRVGTPLPLGVSAFADGVNFAFFSRNATRVRLELFDHRDDRTVCQACLQLINRSIR